jgi:hypothetical protein
MPAREFNIYQRFADIGFDGDVPFLPESGRVGRHRSRGQGNRRGPTENFKAARRVSVSQRIGDIPVPCATLLGAQSSHRKWDQFQDLFRTLLHELMTAKTRVYESDFQLSANP